MTDLETLRELRIILFDKDRIIVETDWLSPEERDRAAKAFDEWWDEWKSKPLLVGAKVRIDDYRSQK